MFFLKKTDFKWIVDLNVEENNNFSNKTLQQNLTYVTYVIF